MTHDPIAALHAENPSIRMHNSAHMLRLALLCLQRATAKRRPMWSVVSDVTGHGSGYSADICRALGLDPDASFDRDRHDRLFSGKEAP